MERSLRPLLVFALFTHLVTCDTSSVTNVSPSDVLNSRKLEPCSKIIRIIIEETENLNCWKQGMVHLAYRETRVDMTQILFYLEESRFQLLISLMPV